MLRSKNHSSIFKIHQKNISYISKCITTNVKTNHKLNCKKKTLREDEEEE